MILSFLEAKINMYMGMDWTYVLKAEPEGGWFIRVYELPGCMSQGDNLIDAYNNIREAMQLWFETALSHGHLMPKPTDSFPKHYRK